MQRKRKNCNTCFVLATFAKIPPPSPLDETAEQIVDVCEVGFQLVWRGAHRRGGAHGLLLLLPLLLLRLRGLLLLLLL